MGSQMKSVFSSNEQKEIKKWGIFSLIFTVFAFIFQMFISWTNLISSTYNEFFLLMFVPILFVICFYTLFKLLKLQKMRGRYEAFFGPFKQLSYKELLFGMIIFVYGFCSYFILVFKSIELSNRSFFSVSLFFFVTMTLILNGLGRMSDKTEGRIYREINYNFSSYFLPTRFRVGFVFFLSIYAIICLFIGTLCYTSDCHSLAMLLFIFGYYYSITLLAISSLIKSSSLFNVILAVLIHLLL